MKCSRPILPVEYHGPYNLVEEENQEGETEALVEEAVVVESEEEEARTVERLDTSEDEHDIEAAPQQWLYRRSGSACWIVVQADLRKVAWLQHVIQRNSDRFR
ncbi:hypothetical protein CYMTET_45423 [Cymbomonas tetramitiformis]|uniref:Uncharacterized protein n=1 Tax=Cymbomonas tetramitiformis TaxID=36881 RepID=A0AAE0EYB6_9CHLO|nr:hypothetical protein CYMTET_45423 [Cymbomonas tetramitiformis]|eukprot:gene1234-1812_t